MTVQTSDDFPYIVDRVKLRSIDEKRYQRMSGLALSRRLKRQSDAITDGDEEIEALRAPPADQLSAPVPEAKQLTLLTQEHGLFGMHLIPQTYTGPVIVTEGEFDAMAVYQETFSRLGYYVLSLPYGASGVPDSLLKQLERFSHLYLWLDADEAGQVGLQKLVSKLPLGRVRIVSTEFMQDTKKSSVSDAPAATSETSEPDSNTTAETVTSTGESDDIDESDDSSTSAAKDANEALMLGQDLIGFIKNASVLDDERFDRFSGLRQEVFQRFAFAEQLRGYPLRSLPRLTSILKGVRLGELTIFSGLTGQGKTTILSQISIDLALQQVPVLWGSFEVKTSKLNTTMMRQYSGVDFRQQPHRYDFFARHFESLPLFFLRAHGSVTVNDLVHRMSTAVGRFGVQVIILDNLQFMLGDHGEFFFAASVFFTYSVAYVCLFFSLQWIRTVCLLLRRMRFISSVNSPLNTTFTSSLLFILAKVSLVNNSLLRVSVERPSQRKRQTTLCFCSQRCVLPSQSANLESLRTLRMTLIQETNSASLR